MTSKTKLWVARDEAIVPEEDEHFLEKCPEQEYRWGKLHIFYDRPLLEVVNGVHKWGSARKLVTIDSYYFPDIKCGCCGVFTLKEILD